MLKISHLCAVALFTWAASDVAVAADSLSWPSTLPVYDHVVIVVEENKDFEQIFAGNFDAPYIKKLAAEGASIARIFGEEHNSQGNYFWLFSGSNQHVGFLDQVPNTANHPDYPRQYRQAHPDYVRHNRQRQQRRDQRRRLARLVKNNLAFDLKHSSHEVWLMGPEATDLVKNNLACSKVLIFETVSGSLSTSGASCKEHPSGDFCAANL